MLVAVQVGKLLIPADQAELFGINEAEATNDWFRLSGSGSNRSDMGTELSYFYYILPKQDQEPLPLPLMVRLAKSYVRLLLINTLVRL